jgi:UDP-N-acetylglucosamine diphosphorylase / glucose-1-phosphate thymidylyltransferase / UDP-N-acetylgalactosamine diphosphorylase / glucosamine-1-phosphate N-acetyltransferase / galactosamine-1-phosphate N-acetyltransferase
LADVVGVQTGLVTNTATEVDTLFLNGRGLWHQLPDLSDTGGAWVGTAGADEVVCIHADADLARQLSAEDFLDEARLRGLLSGLPRRDVSACVTLMTWPWDLVNANEQQLEADWHDDSRTGVHGRVCEGAHLLGHENVFIGDGAVVKPTVVIDAENGPVWIEDDVTVQPHSYIEGPAFIGKGSLIQPSAVVHAGSYLGPVCKVGGEIEGSIIQGFSNKQHDGFLGHSYVCSWVNIAADCVNSDLKNTYGNVRVPINGREVETEEMFVGMFVGDHSKAGINVSFPTGAVIGFCSAVFRARSPKFVPSFAWVDEDRVDRYDETRGLEIARRVMARRKMEMSEAESGLFMSVIRQAMAIERQPEIDEVWPEY